MRARYFHTYFPKAIATAAAVNRPGEPPVFKYTSHAFLLDLFFSCPTELGLSCGGEAGRRLTLGATPDDHPGCLVCPNASEVAAVRTAVENDVITWHAFPFNAEPELADAGLLRAGLAAVRRLDAKFGKPHKTVMSQRDVPGVTRGIVPLLKGAGVLAFSEGCNAQITSPEVRFSHLSFILGLITARL